MPNYFRFSAGARDFRLAILAILLLTAPSPAQEQNANRRVPFQFAAIGDQEYDSVTEAQFPGLMREIDQAKVAFVVHMGDIKAGAGPCTDELLRKRRAEFANSAHPFIYTPGDNEWTDCRAPNVPEHPLERLARLRETFFPAGASLGRRQISLARQSSDEAYKTYVENSYWTFNNVMFALIHAVGSNNNRHQAPEDNTEYQQRTAANIAWLRKTFERARQLNLAAIVIMTQADPLFDLIDQPDTPERLSGFNETLHALLELTLRFAKPVLFVHGDSHTFTIDKPLMDTEKRAIENFTRLEVFGNPYTHWVRIEVDPRQAEPFSFTPQIVRANVVIR